MAPIDFYYMPLSVPSRASLLTARELGLQLNLIEMDLFKGEQFSHSFLKLNPEHVVPTISDNGFVLWESRAICGYLVSQYGKGDWLYPENPAERAKVDKMLMFDMGTLYHRFAKYAMPVIFQRKKPSPKALKDLHEALGWLDKHLQVSKYAAGLTITVADHCLAATVETIKQSRITLARYYNINEWLQRCRENMVSYEENEKGAALFSERLLTCLQAVKD